MKELKQSAYNAILKSANLLYEKILSMFCFVFWGVILIAAAMAK